MVRMGMSLIDGAAATTADDGAAAGAAGADARTVDLMLCGLAQQRAALDIEEAEALQRAWSLGVHRKLGYATFGEYLERELGYPPGVGVPAGALPRRVGAPAILRGRTSRRRRARR